MSPDPRQPNRDDASQAQNPQLPVAGEAPRIAGDQELEDYRQIVAQPATFEEGFGWSTVFGAVFCGLLMVPGAIYLGLLSGMGMSMAARWVTVIIFAEVARRALKPMSKQQMVVLLMVAGAMITSNALVPGGPFGHLIWRQYLVGSDAVKDAGLYGQFPAWWAPAADSPALQQRTFWHSDWAMPIAFLIFLSVNSFIERFTLGYALFRLCSDVERLPFPMAPVGAQGMTALSDEQSGRRSWRWTAFSVGAVLGLSFGALQVGVPAVTGAFLDKPVTPIPLPWLETTQVTEGLLPATPTGLVVDMGLIMLGLVIPFWAVVGAFLTVLLTFVLNPVLHGMGVLKTWQRGMDSVNTMVANQIDFYFSFGIGMALGLAVVSVGQTVRHLWKRLGGRRAQRLPRRASESMGTPAPGSGWAPPAGRGDWSLKLCLAGYCLAAGATVVLCKLLVPQFSLFFLLVFAFVYMPLTSYLNARINGIAGQHIDIPFVREAYVLLSGAKGLSPWLAPLPVENYGDVANEMRMFELTGTKLTSKIKAWLLTTPLILLLGFVFWSFLWAEGPIPSELFPYADKMWDLRARNQMILWSATTDNQASETLFDRAWHPGYVAGGAAFTVITYATLSVFGAPTMLVYGMIRGLGHIPHGLILEFLGALLARFYLHRRFGKKPFLQMAPVLLAGYLSGVGLTGMAAVAVRLIASGISQSPL